MFSPLFWFFAALTLIFGIGVVVNRNPVASALCLVVSFMGLAALFVGLDAYLIGVLQVLVYAGAVMVLFLFIIMLLDLRAERRRKFNFLGIVGGGLVAAAFASQLLFVLSKNPAGDQKFPELRPISEPDAQLVAPAQRFNALDGSELGESVRINQQLIAIGAGGSGTNLPTTQVTPLSASGVVASTANRPAPSAKPGEIDDVRQIGWSIFSNYNLPLQVVGVLLLVATVGVVVLSKRELK